MQDFALASVELHEVAASVFLQPVQIPLSRSPALQNMDCCARFDVIGRLAEDTLCPIIQVKDIRWYWLQW